MRHHVRRQWRQWQDIGTSDQVLRWIQEGVRIPFKHNRPPLNFHNGISRHDATPAQLTFLEAELARFVESGAWEFGTRREWRPYWECASSPKSVPYLFDLQDGFYALGIAEADRDYFTVDVRGQLYMLAGLPMGWSLSPYYFVTLTQVEGNAHILPYVDDFLLFSASMEHALHLCQRLASLLDALGLQRNPTKGV
eukprot:jgi/Tetstr1/466569/TSEL_011071.t1